MRAAHLLFVPLVGAAVACMREGAPVVAPVDVTIGTSDAGAAPLVVVSSPPPTSRDGCSAPLHPASIRTNPGCTLYESISHGDGILYFPCAGDGLAEATFGDQRFRGKLTGTKLTLELKTELDLDDGCHWETAQSIRGEWLPSKDGNNDSSKPAKLAWSYGERPVSGTSCYGSCKALADIFLASGAENNGPTDDDEDP
jgi:hypothetical protein